jgi:hypothetical protein
MPAKLTFKSAICVTSRCYCDDSVASRSGRD